MLSKPHNFKKYTKIYEVLEQKIAFWIHAACIKLAYFCKKRENNW
jgi:hypothetical protein